MDLTNKFFSGIVLSKIDSTQPLYQNADSALLEKISVVNSVKQATAGYNGVILSKLPNGNVAKFDIWDSAESYSAFSDEMSKVHPEISNLNVQIAEKCSNFNFSGFFVGSYSYISMTGALVDTYDFYEKGTITSGDIITKVEELF